VAVQDQAICENHFKNTILQAEFDSNLAVNSGYKEREKVLTT